MVTGTDGDPFEIEEPADIFGSAMRYHEREDTDLVAGRADETDAIDDRKSIGGVGQQFMLVLGDVRKADALNVIERCFEADGIGDVGRARFKFAGGGL